MAVYKRGYQRYQGPLTGRAERLWVLPRYAWSRLLQQRLVVIVLVLALFWPLACGAFVYLANHSELWQGLDGDLAKFLKIDAQFFVIFMNLQGTFAIILAAFAGPGLIAPDLANNALQLYFSRPLSRVDYALARILVLVGLLSPVTWIPGIALFGMQTGMAGWDWFAQHWTIGLGIFLGFALWILLVALVAMACSAYVKWRIVAGGLVLAFFFLLAGAAEMVNGILRVEWASALNPGRAMYTVWCALLGADTEIAGPGPVPCAIALAVTALLLIWVLERKLRPVEVVS